MMQRATAQAPTSDRRGTDQRADGFTISFQSEMLTGLKLSTLGRFVSLAVIAVLLSYLVPAPALYYFEALLSLAVLTGVVHYLLIRSGVGRSWLSYIFILLDFALLTFTLLVPNPFDPEKWPPQMLLRNDPIIFYFMVLASTAFIYSPRLMVWAGLIGGLCWGAGAWWLLSLPETHTPFNHPPHMTSAQHLAEHLDVHFVNTNVWLLELVLFLLVAGILAVVVRRSRRLVIRQAQVASERSTLARYFSPNVLDEVIESTGPLTQVRKHEVAILFADIVGFTSLCETMPPEQVMELLRVYHTRLEEQVFRFGGTLDKFIGDAVMASFGAPRSGPHDAVNGLLCARAMLHSMAEWNVQREALGEAPIQIGIGLHYGSAVMGDVGSERCAAFAVIGDTTNTTSRLQSLTRDLGADLVASQALLEAVRRERPEAEPELDDFRDAGMQTIRGRQKPMHIWMLATED